MACASSIGLKCTSTFMYFNDCINISGIPGLDKWKLSPASHVISAFHRVAFRRFRLSVSRTV